MRMETIDLKVTYKVFDIGEKVRPSSIRCPLPYGTYTVVKFCVPQSSGECSGVFLAEREYGVDTTYLEPVEE